jgi:curved DNA-binding protein CbpA
MPRNPFTVLGVPLDASPDAIRGAWRRLARQHHPDVATGDPGRESGATRTMAEINLAYQELRDPAKRRIHRDAAARAADAANGGRRGGPGFAAGYSATPETDGPQDRPDWVARPRTGRPVTARIDTSALLRPRNATLRPLDRNPLPGVPPRPRSAEWREPPRASTPTGPTYYRRGPSLDADLPSIPNALETRLRFGKFAGLTLGEVGVIEPTYLEWIVRTIDRDPETSLAARVVLRYLGYVPMSRPRLDNTVQRG